MYVSGIYTSLLGSDKKKTVGGGSECECQGREASLRREEPVSSKKRGYCSGASAVSCLLTWTMCTGEEGELHPNYPVLHSSDREKHCEAVGQVNHPAERPS